MYLSPLNSPWKRKKEKKTQKGKGRKIDSSPLDSLLEHLNNSPVTRSSWEQVFDELALLKAFLMDRRRLWFVEDDTLEGLESLASKVVFSISLFDLNLKEMDNDMSFELEMQLFILLMPLRDWKHEALRTFDMGPKPSPSYYPRPGLVAFIDHLVENLQQLVEAKPTSTLPLKHFVSRLRWNLWLCSSYLNNTPEPCHEDADLEGLTGRITKLAYEAEHAIDSFLVEDVPLWHCILWLLKILGEFEQLEIALSDEGTDEIVVGFEKETGEMLEQLILPSKELRIISVVGMPGQGKTTFAKKLYNHPKVIDYFDVRMWCCVSQVNDTKELLLELLSHVGQFSEAIHHKSKAIHQKSDTDLAEMLFKHLKRRRFLVLLDDIWKIEAWNVLRRCFPDDKTGSRIIFTTRTEDLGSQSDITRQKLCALDEKESWELLEKKLFQKDRCPPQLVKIGRQIASDCKGLPLSIVLTAGILAKLEKKVEQWEHVAKALSSLILDTNQAHGKGIIELSYKQLPDYLRPCFLYFGLFLEDREVLVSKLTRLWIAEGFITCTNSKSLEDVAEDYLADLIRRSLVTVAQEKSSGGVKSCRVHDLLHEFCLNKAKEEKFLQLIDGYDKLFTSSNHDQDYGFDASCSYSSTPTIYHLRRLCIYSKRNHFIMLKPSGPLVRSLFFCAASDKCPTYSYDISFISQNFKLLRILNLEDINIADSFEAIGELVRLRCLAVQGSFDAIPSSIVNLKNLETFHVKGLEDKAVKVSGSILKMKKLRHLHINDKVFFDMDPKEIGNSSISKNLQSLSSPSLAYGDDAEKMIHMLRGIKKLKCKFLDSGDDSGNCNQFPTLELLHQLVSLTVVYNGMMRKYPRKFNFPSNLKKLTLSNFRLPWDSFSQLATLCNLEVLKLLGNSFEGETWDMEEEEFPKLKFLKLETLDFKTWIACAENFPCLKYLVLSKCKQLGEIPFDIGDIYTLLMIDVSWCNSGVAISAKSIEESQNEYGKGLKVNIYPNSGASLEK